MADGEADEYANILWGRLMAQKILLALLAAMADRQEGDFKQAARRAIDELLGRPWVPGPTTEGMKIVARREFMAILDMATSGPDPTRRPTLRRRFLSWLQAG